MNDKPTVKLVGQDGNAFHIIGVCLKSARKAGWSVNQIKELQTVFTSAQSYNEILQIAMKNFNIE